MLPLVDRGTAAMAKVGMLRHWRVLAPGLVSGILLVIVCMIMSVPASGIQLLGLSSPQGQDNSIYYSNQVDYYSRQHRLYSPRRILDNEYPRSRPAPTSYPPPKNNVQNAPFRRPQSPPHA